MRRFGALIACAAACASPAQASAAPAAGSNPPPRSRAARQTEEREGERALTIANGLAKVRALRSEYPRAVPTR